MKTIILRKIYIKFCLIALFVFLQSCSKLIETDLPDNQINSVAVYKDITTVKAALSNLYFNVKENPFFRGGVNGIGCDFSKYTDELVPISENDSFYQNAITPNISVVKNYWMFAYRDLYAINLFIEGLTNSQYINQQQKEPFLGEALLLRALYYQYLTQTFGDIPYVTSTNYKINTNIQKSKQAQILKETEIDLKIASKYLSYQYRTIDRVYPNKVVAELLLAKNYLLQQDYTKAQQLAENIINSPIYSLELDIKNVFKKSAKSTIWQFNSASLGNDQIFLPTKEAETYIIKDLIASSLILSEDFINSFENNDQRLNSWINHTEVNNKKYYYPFKYKNKTNNTDEFSIVFRLEDVYFILMEALAYQEHYDQALTYLNIIRTRAGLPIISSVSNKEFFIKIMLQESKKEFFTEFGHRFFDLKRNHQLLLLSTKKPTWKTFNELLPYPESEILLNPNLQPQNNGY